MSETSDAHPLGAMLRDALVGRFVETDGGWRRMTPWRPGLEAVVAFTGHAVLVVAADVPDERLRGLDGLGGAHDRRIVADLAGPDGWIDSLDVLLVADGTGPGRASLVERADLSEHPRVALARRLREDLRVFGFPEPTRTSLVVLARGIGDLVELSFEVDANEQGSGVGRALVAGALGRVPRGKPVVAACAPGNAASLRCLLAAGFVPVGSIQLFQRAPDAPRPAPLDHLAGNPTL